MFEPLYLVASGNGFSHELALALAPRFSQLLEFGVHTAIEFHMERDILCHISSQYWVYISW